MLNRNNLLVLLSCFQCVVCTLFFRYTPIVEVSQGKLRGFRSINGLNQYFGIPYATSERFQRARPPRKWSGVFEATKQFDTCAQALLFLHLGTENCQKLDIYTPQNARKRQKLPVLVFFHGGAYYYGAKWYYDPEYLVKNNVIVVLVNYRLGVLGFLCLNDISNLGLKDQQAALRWVQKNIAAFGGDPDNVTVSGQSAGGSSSSMHILSKQSKGLFHKALLISGVALTPWAFNLEPQRAAFEDAKKLQKVTNEKEVYNVFLKANLDKLLDATHGHLVNPRYFKYSPCVDSNFTDPFFHDTPYQIIKSGDFNKVPTIIGFTDLEGILFYGSTDRAFLNSLDDRLKDRLPSIFSWCSDKDKSTIADKLRSYYFQKQRISSKGATKGAVDLYSDWIAYATIDAYSKLMATYSNKPIYNYMFTYEGDRNYIGFLLNQVRRKGAAHADDLFYLYKPGGITLPASSLDKLIIDRFTTMISNFMKFGDPTPTQTELIPIRWPPISANRTQVMRIDQPLTVEDTPAYARGDFFHGLMCQYGLQGYVPCESTMQCNIDSKIS